MPERDVDVRRYTPSQAQIMSTTHKRPRRFGCAPLADPQRVTNSRKWCVVPRSVPRARPSWPDRRRQPATNHTLGSARLRRRSSRNRSSTPGAHASQTSKIAKCSLRIRLVRHSSSRDCRKWHPPFDQRSSRRCRHSPRQCLQCFLSAAARRLPDTQPRHLAPVRPASRPWTKARA